MTKLVRGVKEDDVRQESVATLSLFRWLTNFTRVGPVAGLLGSPHAWGWGGVGGGDGQVDCCPTVTRCL